MQNITKRLSGWAAVVALILMVPLVAMQFTDEVNWTGSDFVFGAVVLFGSALVYELVAQKGGNILYRAAVGVAVATALLLVWINAAVGIIGDGPVNLMYFGVLVVGVSGASVARLEPPGMALTLFAMTIAQMLVPVIALVFAKPQVTMELPGAVGVFVLNAFFAMLFVASALLFRHASRKHI